MFGLEKVWVQKGVSKSVGPPLLLPGYPSTSAVGRLTQIGVPFLLKLMRGWLFTFLISGVVVWHLNSLGEPDRIPWRMHRCLHYPPDGGGEGFDS